GGGGFGGGKSLPPLALQRDGADKAQMKVGDFVKDLNGEAKLADERRKTAEEGLKKGAAQAGIPAAPGGAAGLKAAREAQDQLRALDMAKMALDKKELGAVQTEKLGVDIAVHTNNLRNQTQVSNSAIRKAYGRNCLEVGGVWIDDGFDPKMKTVTVKAQSAAYFRLLERQPRLREVFTLGNHIVWVTPSGTALVVDTTDGVATLDDTEIDRLFMPGKK